MKRRIYFALIACSFLAACVPPPKPAPTSLQIQAIQTHEFNTSKTIAFDSVLSVFQDLGYIVQSADKNTGFITASSPSHNKTNFWQAMGGVRSSGNTKATAFVEEIRPGVARVRLNFVDTQNLSSDYGQNSSQDTPILDPKPYQVAFNKIGDAIFVREGNKPTSGS